jgi:uncharacterized protein
MERLEKLLVFLVRSLADEPDKVEVSGTESGSRVSFEVRLAEGDMGRIIGKEGRTIKSIRTVMKAASVKLDRRVNVEIAD